MATTATDLSQQIIAQLRELGASAEALATPGLPTLMCGYGRRTVAMDVEGSPFISSPRFRTHWQGSAIKTVSTLTAACQALGLRILIRQQKSRTAKQGRAVSRVKRQRAAA